MGILSRYDQKIIPGKKMIFQLGIGGFLGACVIIKSTLPAVRRASSRSEVSSVTVISMEGYCSINRGGFRADDSSQVACDADMNASCFHIIDIADLQFEILVHFQNLKSHMIIFFTGIRQGKPGRGPVKQRGSQTVFNPFNILAEGRLGDKKLFGGLGYAFLICYCFDINGPAGSSESPFP